MGVRRRANKAALQTESADEALLLLVEHKLQPETSFVGGPTTKAIVGELLFLHLMTVNSFVPGHVVKMNETLWKCKGGLFAVGFDSVIPSEDSSPSRGICGSCVMGNRRSLGCVRSPVAPSLRSG